jgi:hypothetical protein
VTGVRTFRCAVLFLIGCAAKYCGKYHGAGVDQATERRRREGHKKTARTCGNPKLRPLPLPREGSR